MNTPAQEIRTSSFVRLLFVYGGFFLYLFPGFLFFVFCNGMYNETEDGLVGAVWAVFFSLVFAAFAGLSVVKESDRNILFQIIRLLHVLAVLHAAIPLYFLFYYPYYCREQPLLNVFAMVVPLLVAVLLVRKKRKVLARDQDNQPKPDLPT